ERVGVADDKRQEKEGPNDEEKPKGHLRAREAVRPALIRTQGSVCVSDNVGPASQVEENGKRSKNKHHAEPETEWWNQRENKQVLHLGRRWQNPGRHLLTIFKSHRHLHIPCKVRAV